MNKLIPLLFLVLAIAALTTDNSHTQSPRPVQPTQVPRPAQQPYGQPQQPYGQPQQPYGQAQKPYGQAQQSGPINKPAAAKRVGFETEAGDPFGREVNTKRTCFKPPCFEPSSGCNSPRKWNTIFYLVPTVNGQKGRFLGFECK